MDVGYREVVLRPGLSRVLAALVVAICAVAVATTLTSGDADLALRSTAPLCLAGFGAWALFWQPLVRVSPAEVVLVNPLRTVRIAWPAITDVRTRWGLELETAGGRYGAWAAPRSGAAAAGRTLRQEARRRRTGGSEPTGRAASDSAAGTADVVLRQWESYRDRGLLGGVEGAGVVVTRHGWTGAVLLLLAVATVAGAVAP